MTSKLIEDFFKKTVPVEELRCDYCCEKVLHKPLAYKMEYALGDNKYILWDIYYCDKCQAEYLVQGFGAPYINLYVHIGNKTYKWALREYSGRLYFVGEPGIPGLRPNRHVKHVIGFTKPETVPQITPFNIESKVRLLLMFS